MKWPFLIYVICEGILPKKNKIKIRKTIYLPANLARGMSIETSLECAKYPKNTKPIALKKIF